MEEQKEDLGLLPNGQPRKRKYVAKPGRAKKPKNLTKSREANKGANCPVRQWQINNPEAYRAMVERRSKNAGRKVGCYDGMNLEQSKEATAKAKAEAKIIVKAMMEKDPTLEEQYAVEAMETVVELMRTPGDKQSRLAAAKTLLEYTKAKPSTKSEVTINKAEAFLEDILRKEESEE